MLGSEDRIKNIKKSRYMRILWITKLSDNYHFKTSRIELLKALVKRGHIVNLIMEKKIGEKKSNDNIIYIPSLSKPIFSSLIFSLYLIFYIPYLTFKLKPDIILIDETTVWLPYAIILKICRTLIVLDIRTLPVDNRRPLRFSISMQISKFISNAYTMITPELYEILNQRFKLSNNQVGFWSSGVSIDNFSIKKNINNKRIEKYRKNDALILMYHGSYSPTRGIENLIISMNKLKPEIKKNVILKIVGIEQSNIEYLSDFCKKQGNNKNIEFFPKVEYEEISKCIFSSDVGIVPLPVANRWWYSSAPLKTLEYLAMEKPIIVTNIPFHHKIFEKGECGVLLDENTPDAIADAIIYLYQNKERSVIMGKKGRDIVEKYYSWDYKAMEVEKFLENILTIPK